MEENLLKQERDYSFQCFSHQDALEIGIRAQAMITSQCLKAIGIRILYNDQLIFQYLMDGKKDDIWLKRKERTVLESGHSSYYVFHHQENYTAWIDNNNFAICGGGFPIIENGECKGAICISGLEHQEDHNLIIQLLEERKNKQ